MGVAEDVEVFFPVGVAFAGVVGADGFPFEGVAGGLVEAGGEGVGESVAFGGVAGPAGGGVPTGAVAGGVDVEEDEETLAGSWAVQMALARRTRSLRGGMSSVSGTRSWALWPLSWRVARIWLALCFFLIWNSVSIIYCSDPTMPTQLHYQHKEGRTTCSAGTTMLRCVLLSSTPWWTVARPWTLIHVNGWRMSSSVYLGTRTTVKLSGNSCQTNGQNKPTRINLTQLWPT